MTRHARLRLRIALTVILCLLFQQVAMAAYACTSPDMSPEPVVSVALHDDVPLDRSDPPPRLRYCSLLI